MKLSWLSATPFGLPSEPEVKTITAGSSGRARRAAARGNHSAHAISQSLSASPNFGRRSSRQTTSTPSSLPASAVSRIFSRNARDVITVRNAAARHALWMASCPAV